MNPNHPEPDQEIYNLSEEAATGRPPLPEGAYVAEAAWTPSAETVLVPGAVSLVVDLHRMLEGERKALLAQRAARQARWDAGELPAYPPKDSAAATGKWRVGEIPVDLRTRRVEITGPANSAKMVINMLSRRADGVRADTAMLDMEDALKPSWGNIMDSLVNIRDAAAGQLEHLEPARDDRPEKRYRLDPRDSAVMIVRPRGLHLLESNFLVDGEPVSAALFDLVLSFYHAGPALVARGLTPAYYIPKTEEAPEAGWWAKAFSALEGRMGMPVGNLKATFLIETLPAALQMEEILHAARQHAVGLNVGRWDKIFSDIKSLRMHGDRVLGDRAGIGMQQPWMANYAMRCVKICHSRGAYAMGGMAAFTPGKTEEIRAEQVAKVFEDKRLEASLGHDGCWVSHPFFIEAAMQAFAHSNQMHVLHEDKDKYPPLLPEANTACTLQGLRTNVRVGIGYMEGWNRDLGCVAWDNLMEDLATLEISRAQTWQWLHHRATLSDGSQVEPKLVSRIFREELQKIIELECAELARERGETEGAVVESFAQAAKDAEGTFLRENLSDFLFDASEQHS